MSQDDIDVRDKFLFTLEWLLAVTQRYPGHLQFGLAHIDFENPRLLGEAYGAQKASQKLDEVSLFLRRACRKTDLVMRDGCDFWVLIPYTPANEQVVDKIKYIIDTVSRGGLQIVERDISFFSLPMESLVVGADSSAQDVLAHLKENRRSLAAREISLPARD